MIDNSSNSSDETLFNKVFKNKYLNNKIFQMISSSECNRGSKEYQPIYLENRIKFKYIYNVKWMIDNVQFQLLKCKLLNNQEYLEIKLNCFQSLFSIDLTTTPKESISIELYKEIIQLLLKRRDKKSLEIDDILESVITYGTLQTINIFFECLNQVHSATTSKISFESIILNSFYDYYRFYQIRNFIQTNKVEPQVLKHFRYNLVLSHLQLQQEIKQRDTQLISSFGKSNFLQITNQKSEVVLDSYEMVEFINSLIFGKHHSTTIGNRDKINKLLLCIKLYNEFKNKISVIDQQDEDEEDEEITIKKLVGKFIILSESRQLFKEYMVKYNQILVEMVGIYEFYSTALEYTLSNYIPQILKCLQLDNDLGHLELDPFNFHCPLVFENKERSIEFLKVYLSKLNQFKLDTTTTTTTDNTTKIESYTVKLIYKVMFSINDQDQYEDLYNNHISEYYQSYLPSAWNSIIGNFNKNVQFVMVQNIETIDWMRQWFTKRLKFNSVLLKDSIRLPFDHYIYRSSDSETIELSNYSFNQLSLFGDHLSIQTFYYAIFIKSIKQGNLKNIKLIHSLGITFNDIGFDYHILCSMNCSSLNEPTSYQEYNELINFIFENQMVSIHSLYSIIKFITVNGYYDDVDGGGKQDVVGTNGSIEIKYNLSKLKFNINQDETVQQTILNSFYHYDKLENYNFVKFVLDNFKFTISNYDNSQNIHIKGSTLLERKDKFISLINLFINQIQQCKQIIISNSTKSVPLPNLQIYYEIISRLFNCLLLDDTIEIEQVNLIYQLLVDNTVELTIGQYVKLYYIKNKSIQLYNYSKHGLLNSPDEFPSPTIEKLSLRFIQNSTIDQLMESIIYRPYLLYNDDNKINFNDDQVTVKDNFGQEEQIRIVYPVIINYNLQFYLYIKRNDLFLKEWDFLVTTCKLKQLPTIGIIRPCCINLELQSINNILQVISNNYNNEECKKENQHQILQFCTISMKLGKFGISILSFKLLIQHCRNDFLQFINKIENYIQFDFMKNRNSLIIELDTIIDKNNFK